MPWQKKSDAPGVVVLDSGAISQLLAAFPQLVYLAPALAGRTIDTVSFCAAGPPYDPAVTMADIVWFGATPNDNRPHTLLTVSRAIADQELFARYCELPSGGTGSWHTYAAMACGTGPDVWDCVVWAGSAPLPAWATRLRMTVISGNTAALALSISWPSPMSEGVACDVGANAISHSGYGGVHAYVGGSIELDISQYNQALGSAYPFAVRRGGTPPAIQPFCETIEYYGVAPTGAYTPPVGGTDPNVSLPDGTGATIDELETKLDFLQLELRALAGRAFALDVTTATGAGDLVAGELGDAVGLLVTIVDRPMGRTSWSDDPPRYPHLAQLTLGTEDGWWSHVDVEHESTVVMPLPAGATRWSVKCQPPMLASVTLYRPINSS